MATRRVVAGALIDATTSASPPENPRMRTADGTEPDEGREDQAQDEQGEEQEDQQEDEQED